MSTRPVLGKALVLVLASVTVSVDAAGGEPSPAFRAELRRTLALRKERRRTAPRPSVGVIETYPMPPALIIRQTREAHEEIGALLDLLR